MYHLLESKSFFDLEEVKSIVRRYKDTGYVSVQMSKRLDHLFMTNNVCNKLYEKCEELIEYFYGANRELLDDIIFEFFDATGYSYTVSSGIFLPSQWYGMSSIDFKMSIPDSFEESPNKEYELFLMILEKMMFSQDQNIQKGKEELEKRKSSKDWNKYTRSRDLKFYKIMNGVGHLRPCFNVDFKQDRYTWEQLDDMLFTNPEQYMNLEGFKSDDFYTYKSDSILNRIKSRLSYFSNEFGQVDNIEYNSIYSQETMRRWWGVGDELIINQNPILLKGRFTIKFKL
jgi:hypothetical protein